MARLIYATLASLDGFIEDRDGKFDWAFPSDEVHQFFNDLSRPAGTYLYGRRMYETMAVWETEPSLAEESAVMRDYAQIWQAADKVVYSRSLAAPVTARTRIERAFDPEAVRALKAQASRDLAIGGAQLAAQAFAAGLIDECHLVLAPVVVGGGKRALPDQRLKLSLVNQRRFEDGMVHLHYTVQPSATG